MCTISDCKYVLCGKSCTRPGGRREARTHLVLTGIDRGVVGTAERVQGHILHFVHWLARLLLLQHCMRRLQDEGKLRTWMRAEGKQQYSVCGNC